MQKDELVVSEAKVVDKGTAVAVPREIRQMDCGTCLLIFIPFLGSPSIAAFVRHVVGL